MATNWSELITDNALVLIDDARLRKELATSPAQFFRKMSLYVEMALPLLNRPPQLFDYIKREMVEPTFDDFEWTSTAESVEAEQTEVDTEKIGYELCSVCILDEEDGTLMPYGLATYNAETGIVTFPKQEKEGIIYCMDFYNDGSFADLTESMRRLFALAISLVWDERFGRNWLNMQMKIKDASFDTVNESNYIQQTTERTARNKSLFNSELRKYEQDVAYKNTVKNKDNITLI